MSSIILPSEAVGLTNSIPSLHSSSPLVFSLSSHFETDDEADVKPNQTKKEETTGLLQISGDSQTENNSTDIQTKWTFYNPFVIFRYLSSLAAAPFVSCLPAQPSLAGDIATSVKSPYDKFNGSFSFVVTVLGGPKVGKSTMCLKLKECENAVDARPRRLFSYSSVPPEIQVSITVPNPSQPNSTRKFDLGVYDSVGFTDVELLKYLLEGQSLKSDNSFEIRESPKVERTKRRKKIDSEAFIVMFDVQDLSSFELACSIMKELFHWLSFDPHSNARCPVTVFLVGNKIDCVGREVGIVDVRSFIDQQLGHVTYCEVSSLTDSKTILKMFSDLACKIQEQREAYYQLQQKIKRASFWD